MLHVWVCHGAGRTCIPHPAFAFQSPWLFKKIEGFKGADDRSGVYSIL